MDRRVGDRRGARLRAPLGRAPWRRHPGHQDVPLPRPHALLEPSRVHVGPHRRVGDGQPRVHRLPAADGALLRGLSSARRAGLGGTAALARDHSLRGRPRRPLPLADPRAPGTGPHRRPRSPTCSRPTSCSTPGGSRSSCCPGPGCRSCWASRSSPCAVAVGASPPSSPSSSPWSVASTPAPSSTSASRPSCGSSTPWWCCASRPGATRWRLLSASAVLTLGACLWWIAGLAGRGGLRRQRPQVHRDRSLHLGDVEPGRGHPRPRVLVLLRQRPPRPVDVRGRALHAEHRGCSASSFVMPVLALVAAAFVRWRERAYFLVLLFVGLVLSVGPFPFANPTVIGRLLKSFMTDTTAGLAMRSTDRATPLVLLALVMLLGRRAHGAVAPPLPRRHWDRRRRRRTRDRQRPVAVQRRTRSSPAASHSRPRSPPTSWPPSTI